MTTKKTDLRMESGLQRNFSISEKRAVLGGLILLVQSKAMSVSDTDESCLAYVAQLLGDELDERTLKGITDMGSETIFEIISTLSNEQKTWYFTILNYFLTNDRIIDEDEYMFAKFLCFEMGIESEKWITLTKKNV